MLCSRDSQRNTRRRLVYCCLEASTSSPCLGQGRCIRPQVAQHEPVLVGENGSLEARMIQEQRLGRSPVAFGSTWPSSHISSASYSVSCLGRRGPCRWVGRGRVDLGKRLHRASLAGENPSLCSSSRRLGRRKCVYLPIGGHTQLMPSVSSHTELVLPQPSSRRLPR